MSYKIVLYLDNSTVQLATAVIDLSLWFKPAITFSPSDIYNAYLQFYLYDSKTVIVSAVPKTDESVLFSQDGIAGYVQSFFQSCVMQFFSTFALGSGIKLSTGWSLDRMRSLAVLGDTGTTAILYSPLIQ